MEQVAAINLGGRVVLPGATDDITAEYLQADLFVTSAQGEVLFQEVVGKNVGGSSFCS